MTQIRIPPGVGPIINVDDDEEFHFLLNIVYNKTSVPNKLLNFASAEKCLTYMEAVRSGAEPMPVLILVDVNMPRIDGFDLVIELREMPEFADIPFIAMFTNSNSPDDMARAEMVGADQYYVKPARIMDLRFTPEGSETEPEMASPH